jgi:hypothetical protein
MAFATRRASRPRAAAFVDPQLAQLRKEPPSRPNWVHELKLDGAVGDREM